jgi:hypothetical protein
MIEYHNSSFFIIMLLSMLLIIDDIIIQLVDLRVTLLFCNLLHFNSFIPIFTQVQLINYIQLG